MTSTDATVTKTDIELIAESLPGSTDYRTYREMVSKLVSEKATTGSEQTETLIDYTKLNDRRMARWDKTFKLPKEAEELVKKLDKKVLWLVLTESWCGDAAHAMPIMNKLAELSPNLEFRAILRDENLELMNRFLTNGTLSIPKLIAVDQEAGEILYTWGPRPSVATKLVSDYKKEHDRLTPEFKQELQLWYNKDKGQNILEDLLELLALK
ncbi:thioredoxin family protein [Allomuricauda sp. SCSIO 65647]|uniref:thioredoxin family protein n=1 Tax=Allomuricauda sp. SCSIO 65647 TaxID=2908843 RepID=UPI001F16A51A|nr:thioredoxin family protein [Muricauda sp. SCSIO 65647]UJH66175.1 thioredoxin family protein [Muricauda sp. SCSIO 65647]